MAWSYHKHIKIIPGIRLNIGKSGVRTTIGLDMAGIHPEDAGPPPAIHSIPKNLEAGAGFQPPSARPGTGDNIFSADIQEITSKGMQGIREAMQMSRRQQQELARDLEAVRRKVRFSRLKLNISHLLLYGIINRSVSRKIREDIAAQDAAILQISEQIKRSAVVLRTDFEPGTREQYQQVIQAFKGLMASEKIWDVTSAHYQDRVAARSSASTLVSKREVRFDLQALPELSSDPDVLHFQNANGADLYFYPGFVVMYASPESFALIGLEELIFSHGAVRFTETGPVPGDSTIIDRTWTKVNKNGTPDKRFKSNYQIPIVRYGELRLKTASGLHEEYECSNYEATEAFGLAFKAYQRHIRMVAGN